MLIAVTNVAQKIFDADADRTPMSVRNIGEFPVRLILNQIADRGGNSVEINIPAGGATDFDGSYKGEVWARTTQEETGSQLEIWQ